MCFPNFRVRFAGSQMAAEPRRGECALSASNTKSGQHGPSLPQARLIRNDPSIEPKLQYDAFFGSILLVSL